MRINKYIAQATRFSRRGADAAIAEGRVLVNGKPPEPGADITDADIVTIDGRPVASDIKTQTIMMNKPADYVCSREGQGSLTIYDLLPPEYHNLNSVGRLDKASSGLILLTNDGQLAEELTHPSHQKEKIYEIHLNKELTPEDFEIITKQGVQLADGMSKFKLDYMNDKNFEWKAILTEGRNRQIRRTFESLGYAVINLHRTHFGRYALNNLKTGEIRAI